MISLSQQWKAERKVLEEGNGAFLHRVGSQGLKMCFHRQVSLCNSFKRWELSLEVRGASHRCKRRGSRAVLRSHSSYLCYDFGNVIKRFCPWGASYVNGKVHNLLEWRWRLSESTHVKSLARWLAHRKCTIQIYYIIMIFVLNQGSENDETSLRSCSEPMAEPGVKLRSGRL